MKPVIAMPQMGNDLFRKFMKSKYVQSVERAGGTVRWIELESPDQAVEEMLKCDGLLLPGGADINPERYGQTVTEKCGKPNTLRDNAEFKMLEAFLKTGKPVLCICRGCQLLNVFCGGTLQQDIKDVQKCKHVHMLSAPKGIHYAHIMPGTKISSILKDSKTVFVNSLHHQAVDCVSDHLVIAAESEDGFVEALEMPDHPFCIGFQWHPEHMSKKVPLQQGIFDAYIKACKGD